MLPRSARSSLIVGSSFSIPKLGGQSKARQRAIALLAQKSVGRQAGSLPEYPFDAQLLSVSALYRKSRTLYVKGGGKFQPTLVSGARALSSPILLDQLIEYTPLERELIWLATDPIERRSYQKTTELRRLIPSLFHEQNHRILWRLLPPAPRASGALRRYLNFAESLVITADMALGDELGSRLGCVFNLIGLTYDPGTDVRALAGSRRGYRNYLQACLHATYLNLEAFDRELIEQVIPSLYANTPLASRAVARASNLNRAFITQTNLIWQRRHRAKVILKLGGGTAAPLQLTDDPLNNHQQYLFAEKWFQTLGL